MLNKPQTPSPTIHLPQTWRNTGPAHNRTLITYLSQYVESCHGHDDVLADVGEEVLRERVVGRLVEIPHRLTHRAIVAVTRYVAARVVLRI